MEIYFIGGSPCCGKSTVAAAIVSQYGFDYFKIDDELDRYTDAGRKLGFPVCSKQLNSSADQIWLRSPAEQAAEERLFYHEIFPLVLRDMKKRREPLIVEGAALLPELIHGVGIPWKNYLCMTPTEEFQIAQYSKREWVSCVLRDCTDPQKAFENWMKRDALFAETVRRQCERAGYLSMITDGTRPIEDMISDIVRHFGL